MVSGCYRICPKPGEAKHFRLSRAWRVTSRKRRGLPRRFDLAFCCGDQRNSCSTLACAWLASARAETAIDWRVASAWLFAASSLVSASVRLAEPVCSTLIRFFEKSWRICTIDKFEPRVEACVRNASDALVILAIVALAEALSRLADRLLAAKATFNWSRDSLAPKVMLVAVPPPVEAIVRTSPALMMVPSTRLAELPVRATAEVTVDLGE